MSERFPIGSAVRVANNGQGSRWREIAIGAFAGTVIATGTHQHKSWSIPEVCVESATGERRVILVGDLEADPDAGRLTLEEALADAYSECEDKPAVRVEITYEDGTEEIVSNIPSNEIAAGIYAEACGNGRVRRAELVRGDGTIAATYPVPEYPRAAMVPGTCGRYGSRSVVRALALSEHPSCGRLPGHLGQHRSVPYISGRMANQYWGDNECLPLDSGQ